MVETAQVVAAWVHDLNPFAVRFTEGFGIRWYGLAYVAGFVAAWWVLGRLARRGLVLLKPEAIADAVLFLVIGVMVGGRLGYCLVYRPSLLTEFSGSFPFWGVLDLMSGGMASHGGIVGVVAACWGIARVNKVAMRHVMDCVACVAPIGIFFGRVANFVNGELLGRVAAAPGSDAPWWSVRYPQEILERFDASGRTEEQSRVLELVLERFARMEETTLAPAAERMIRAIQEGDRALREEVAPLLSARHPSQVYQAVAEGLVVLAVVWLVWRRPRKPGVVSAAFLIAYGVGRVLTEFIRLPDAHFGDAGLIAGLSRGQWMSVAMVAVGMVLWVLSARSSSALVGGWSRAKRQQADRPVA